MRSEKRGLHSEIISSEKDQAKPFKSDQKQTENLFEQTHNFTKLRFDEVDNEEQESEISIKQNQFEVVQNFSESKDSKFGSSENIHPNRNHLTKTYQIGSPGNLSAPALKQIREDSQKLCNTSGKKFHSPISPFRAIPLPKYEKSAGLVVKDMIEEE